LVLTLAGCGASYGHVNQGWGGATSPSESGQLGAEAYQAAPYGSEDKAKEQHEYKPIEEPVTNGYTDPSMEGSGNLAAQGSYAEQVKNATKKSPAPLY
jgi:hypothetical protein